jgi:hypothetical protein
VTDPDDHLWYYGALATALHGKVPEQLADELRRTVEEVNVLANERPAAGWSRALSSEPRFTGL